MLVAFFAMVSMIRKILERASIPVVMIVFICLLIYVHYCESVRIAEDIRALEEAAFFRAQIALEAENMENFKATAYCVTGITKSGVPVAPGQVAADPRVIPLGSMIYVESPLMSGLYQVTDTGRLIKGKIIDIFIPSYRKSIEFGRRDVRIKVLRYGYEGELEPPKTLKSGLATETNANANANAEFGVFRGLL